MPTRDIVCLNCGFAGKLDIHHKKDATMKDGLFKHLGHNPYSGDLHYRCPACEIVLLVDPMAALGENCLKGFSGLTSARRFGKPSSSMGFLQG
ncbi:MAG: hypothetical protein ACOYOS_24055 [Syntrophales bacterium]